MATISPPKLRFHLLGHARVIADGEPFPMATPRKSLPVLACLLLNRGTPISRAFLAYQIWPDETEEGARAKLRATLYDLVRALPPAPEGHFIAVDATNVRWSADDVWLDVDAFEAAAAQPDQFERAIDLYVGDFLEALYDEWLVAPRERFRSTYLATLERVVARCRRSLDFQKAIGFAKRLVDADPLREDVIRRLIALRYEAGDRAGAIDEYERFAQRVHDELGIDPMPETKALRDSIARNEAIRADDSVVVEPPRPAPPRTRLPFVGRHAEREQLLDAWSRASRGRGGIVFVGGEPGIGKSRLVAEFASEAEERGGRTLVGVTGAPESMPYQAFIEALRSSLPVLETIKLDGVWLAALAALLPELSSRFGDVPVLSSIEPDKERDRLFGALARTYAAIAAPRPLLLVLEDLHWAAESTIAALTFIGRRVALAPVLVVATYRDNETIGRHPLRRARSDAMTEGIAKSLMLRPLSRDDVGALTAMLRDPAADADALYRASEGSPLFLGELLEARADVGDGSVSRVGDVIKQRLEALSPESRRLVEFAALAGPRFSREAVREAGGWDEPAFRDALDELVDSRIVREATGRGALDYAFGHQSIRDVAETLVPQSRLADRHRRIARAVEALHPGLAADAAPEMARHYEIAGDPQAAAVRYLAAGRRAIGVAALDEAILHLERGLTLAVDLALRKELLVTRAEISERMIDRAGLAAVAEELEALAFKTDDDEARRTAALLAVRYQVLIQDDEAGYRSALERLKELCLSADSDARWRTIYHLEAARWAYGHSDLDRLEASATEALANARAYGDAAAIARALTSLADLATNRAELATAQSLLDEVRVEAAKARDGTVELDALRAAFMLAYNRADAADALAIAAQWIERGDAIGDRQAEASGRLRRAIARTSTRREIALIRADLASAMSTFEDLRWQRGVAGVLLNQAILENEIGDFDAAVAMTERALAIFVPLGDARGHSTALANLASLHSTLGDGKRALREANEALAVAKSGGLNLAVALAMENVAVATGAVGDYREAIRLADEALAMHQTLDFTTWSGRILGDVALWHLRLGEQAEARARVERMLSRGIQVWAEWPQRFHWHAALVLHATGDDRRAAAELQRARSHVDGLAAELSGGDRDRFLAVPLNRAIAEAGDRGIWPDPQAL